MDHGVESVIMIRVHIIECVLIIGDIEQHLNDCFQCSRKSLSILVKIFGDIDVRV